MILVVDDDTSVRETIAATLQFGGYAVAMCADPWRVEAMVRQYHPRLVLLDLMMQDRNGWDVLLALHTQWPRLRVLLVSAYMTPVEAQEFLDTARRRGARGYLAKPFEMDALLATVEEALR